MDTKKHIWLKAKGRYWMYFSVCEARKCSHFRPDAPSGKTCKFAAGSERLLKKRQSFKE